MAKAQTLTVFECDGCGYLVPAEGDVQPKGFHGTVQEIHPDGNSGTKDFFAHTDRCIKSSILSVLGLS